MTLKYVREKLGPAESTTVGIQKAMRQLVERNEKVVCVYCDSAIHHGFDATNWLLANAPNRLVELGIAEGNAAVVCAGLAAEGWIPFWAVLAFAGVGRAYNQIRQCICVDRFNVKIYFGNAGYFGGAGISHNYIEDIAALRVLPNMVIINPADTVEGEKAMHVAADYVGPVYIRREASPPASRIFEDDYEFNIGVAPLVREGDDATIIATGFMVTRSLQAADLLSKEGVDVRIVNMSTIKPIDEDAVVKAAKETGAIVTAENHMIIGGLGEAVATVLAENVPTPMTRIGMRDEFSQSGVMTPEGVDELGVYFNLMPGDIAAAVKEVIKKK